MIRDMAEQVLVGAVFIVEGSNFQWRLENTGGTIFARSRCGSGLQEIGPSRGVTEKKYRTGRHMNPLTYTYRGDIEYALMDSVIRITGSRVTLEEWTS